jgi:hypothetical protein
MQNLIWLIEYDCVEGPAFSIQAHENKNNNWTASAEPWFIKTDTASLKRFKSKWQYAKCPELVFVFTASENHEKLNHILPIQPCVWVAESQKNTKNKEIFEHTCIPIEGKALSAYQNLKKLGLHLWLAVKSKHHETNNFSPAVFIKVGNKNSIHPKTVNTINIRQITINSIAFLFLLCTLQNNGHGMINSKFTNTKNGSNQWSDEALQLCKKLNN